MIAVGDWTFDNEEDGLSFFEEKLFEIKQHLQQKPLLRATIKSRISQLTKLSQLEEQLPILKADNIFVIPDFSEKKALDQWSLYSSFFSKWKLQIFQAESAKEMLQSIEFGFQFMKAFYSLLPDFDWKEEDPKVGVAENVMYLQAGFHWMNGAGIQTFSELGEQLVDRMHENETIKLFAMELKRLSLRLPYL